ncbi:MAG: YggS family pyridoxal phosphate-dependent enzyme [Muribaculaceae bacterium]|nr:YggS family pyridoxal phosphate-dependent enzyme [Muribaculaceae bacterium]
MPQIAHAIARIGSTLPEGVELVAVSKFHPVEALREAYDAGQRLFGESRVQEIVEKMDSLPDDIRWHFIGHLQSNKVRRLVATRRVALIESIDSERLLRLVDAESEKAGIVSRVLLQVHVAREETKTGFLPEELRDFFRRRAFETLKATHICGLMGMASNTDDTARVEADFAEIAALMAEAKDMCPDLRGFDALSMGMSHDYPLAIAHGATLVRVGTAIFGEREY